MFGVVTNNDSHRPVVRFKLNNFPIFISNNHADLRVDAFEHTHELIFRLKFFSVRFWYTLAQIPPYRGRDGNYYTNKKKNTPPHHSLRAERCETRTARCMRQTD